VQAMRKIWVAFQGFKKINSWINTQKINSDMRTTSFVGEKQIRHFLQGRARVTADPYYSSYECLDFDCIMIWCFIISKILSFN